MTAYITLSPIPVHEGCNPTPHQVAIYRFYDNKYSDEAETIYSTEWLDRSLKYRQTAEQSPSELKDWADITAMSFSTFFSAHPIAAFGLWKILQASYALDRVVCSTKQDLTAGWESFPPFRYLESTKIQRAWRKCLVEQRKLIASDKRPRDAAISWLYDLVQALNQMDHALADLRDNWKENLQFQLANEMVDAAERAVQLRKTMIEDQFPVAELCSRL